MTETTTATRLIKKYPNRRLYDTYASSYITLVDIKQLVLDHESFVVVDSKTEEDITRGILLQIILEEESGQVPIFTANVLAQIIRFYGSTLQGVMGSYIEKNIQAFIEIQERMAEQSKNLYGGQLGPEAWSQFMAVQTPVLQNAMNNYIEQSQQLFVQMQEQMRGQGLNIFGQFPFPSSTYQPKDNKDK